MNTFMKSHRKARREQAVVSESKFKKLIKKNLLPLLPGACLKASTGKGPNSRTTVTFRGPCTLSLKPTPKSVFHFEVTRSQPFAKASAREEVAEYNLAQSFVQSVQAIAPGLGEVFETDIVKGLGRRIVAGAIKQDARQRRTVLTIMDQMTRWAARSYEGKPISAAMGVNEDRGGDVEFRETCNADFAAVLTNGSDTMIECSADGKIRSYHALAAPAILPEYAPHRLAGLAEWSKGGKIGLSLNRSGEILVLKHSRLVFVCRRGKWSFLTHEPIITQMGCPQSRAIRRAVYSSALDASFARTGACIGIVTSGYVANNAWKAAVPKTADHLQALESPKTAALAQMIGCNKFQELDRRFRQELLAIDGATLIGHDGTVLAVGAILKIEGGSTGGGRLAAAQTLSQYGLGIKVSQDGPIQGFRSEPGVLPSEPVFSVM